VRIAAIGFWVATLAAAASGHETEQASPVALPPIAPLRYTPPEPGSYALPPVQQLEDHRLLDHTGEVAELPGLGQGQVALVSLVYLSCPAACPTTHAVMQQVDRDAALDPLLRERLRLVTVSFDPARDTPERMARLRSQLEPRLDWRFLTAADPRGIEPVLADFGQDVRAPAALAEDGRIEHVLKVFLLDGQDRVRNVYSAEFLDPRLLLNDVRTLLAESPGSSRP
jgi:cytochrome oxidase Cu insertion factor (SCO1/SenC/PrrC family)